MDIPVITAIDGALGTATRAIDLVGRLRGIFPGKPKELAAALDAVTQLKEEMTAAKTVALALKEENVMLREENFALKQQLADRQEAKLRKIATGAFAYVFGDDPDTLQNGPWYCQTCFDQGTKAVFQYADRQFRFDAHKCPSCGTTIQVPNKYTPPVPTVSLRR